MERKRDGKNERWRERETQRKTQIERGGQKDKDIECRRKG